MKALVLHGVRDLRLEEVPKPQVNEKEVLLRVGACGICGTDLHFYRGEWRVKTPLIPGHEFSGVIEEVGPGAEWLERGSRVVAEPNITCGHCYYCRMEQRNFYCSNIKATGVDVDGAFAEYVKVPASNVYEFPDWMSFEEAALIEPLACCLRGLYNVKIEPGDTVAVVGAGPVGLLLIQLAKMWGASQVYAVDLLDTRLSLAKQLGADATINVMEDDADEVVKSLTEGFGVDVAIEAVGSSKAISVAMRLARRGGRVLVFGVAPEDDVLPVKPFELYDKELLIVSSYRSPFTFQRAVKIASSRRISLRPIVSHVMELERGVEAFRMLDERKSDVVKVALKP
ncbi:MAG: zinc-dependent alcohol dehydrogenase family protein [Thermofilaceae archaeon]|nr:zinc-dependent alcohol dehydrogenase family protein [Thermofilaceae archaeon]MCX8180945.1 zinc-dependent alcohol dehydrogenase family protein [Thermofilaceae archaeon]MDW8004050.1 zinc-dependent alcohol dehydrogenase family protein [Thermofilaceae archaeon]